MVVRGILPQATLVLSIAAMLLLSVGGGHAPNPADASGLRAQRVSAGIGLSCAATLDGFARCWGANGDGQLGNLEFGAKQNEPVLVCEGIIPDLPPPMPLALDEGGSGGVTCLALDGVDGIATGRYHACAVSDGAVRCWGDNSAGQLGDGTTTDRAVATDVVGLSSGVENVVAGAFHTCASLLSGAVKCWGDNGAGQIGDGTTTDRHMPVDVPGLTAYDLAAGEYHTCAVRDDGAMACWGANDRGQLGDGTTTDRLSPTTVATHALFDNRLAAGRWHTCGVGDGVTKCWGDNGSGQLGDGTNVDRLEPVDVSGLPPGDTIVLAAGRNHTCAISGGHVLRCWGDNSSGQLGDGTTTDRNVPAEVAITTNIGWVGAGWDHTCAARFSRAVSCWGNNTSGELGDGTNTDSETPVTVVGFAPKGIGDADCSGEVDPIDAALVLQFSAGLITFLGLPCPPEADANEDGGIDPLDAALILQFGAGLVPSLPP